MLGIPFREFESFERGLFRYRLNIVNNELEKEGILVEMAELEAIQIELNKKVIDKYRPRIQRRFSECDKFEFCKKQGMPLIPSFDLLGDNELTSGIQDDFDLS